MKKNTFEGFGRLLYGGDYNPEQWVEYPDILMEDIELMKKAHINTVSIGIFSWAVLESEEGKFDFSWLEERINTLYENGIFVFLATPSGARPKWMTDKYPEILRVDESRHRNLFGGRHNHCYTSPIYRDKVRIINTELVRRFGNHPGVLAWHISNEFGGECHCPLCQKAFQEWLKERYGAIEELNRKWYTKFWSHSYQSFEQVESPSCRGEQFLHGLNLDWRRFVTEQTTDFIKHEIKAIRDAGNKKPVTTNFMYHFNDINYHKVAKELDFVSWDSYPTWHKEPEYLTAIDNGMQHDIMRSLKGRPFFLMESCPSATNWQSVSKLKRPGILEMASFQAIAHGAESIMYFQIRQSRGASEKFHGAVIDHYGGTDTRVFKEVCDIGVKLEMLREIAGAKTKAKVAVVYDWENRWALEDAAGPRNKNLYYKETVKKSYAALRKQGMDVDIIDMEQSLDEYQFVAVPMLYMFRERFNEKVKIFVERGGTLIMTYWSGIVDESDLCFLGGTPHGLMDVLGLRSKEIDALYDGEYNQAVPVRGNHLGLKETYMCRNLCDLVHINIAKPLMVYEKEFYAGYPVLTYNTYGKGKAYYIGADMEQSFYDDFYQSILKELCLESSLGLGCIPEGVLVNSRETELYTYIFIQNFNRQEVKIEFPEDGKILFGEYDGSVKGFSSTILCRENKR